MSREGGDAVFGVLAAGSAIGILAAVVGIVATVVRNRLCKELPKMKSEEVGGNLFCAFGLSSAFPLSLYINHSPLAAFLIPVGMVFLAVGCIGMSVRDMCRIYFDIKASKGWRAWRELHFPKRTIF